MSKKKKFVGFRLRRDLDNDIERIKDSRPRATKTDVLEEAIERGLKYLKRKR